MLDIFAVVLDCSNREIVGWLMRRRMTCDIVIEDLAMAIQRKSPQKGLPFHSDLGASKCVMNSESL